MPSRYPVEVRRQVAELARSGTRVAQLAETFGMSEAVLYGWLKQERNLGGVRCRTGRSAHADAFFAPYPVGRSPARRVGITQQRLATARSRQGAASREDDHLDRRTHRGLNWSSDLPRAAEHRQAKNARGDSHAVALAPREFRRVPRAASTRPSTA